MNGSPVQVLVLKVHHAVRGLAANTAQFSVQFHRRTAVSSAGGSNCVGVVAQCGRCSSIQAPRGQPSVKAPRASRRRRKGKAHMSGWRISPDAGEGQERVVVLDDDLPTLVRPAGPQRHEERMGALRQVVKAAAPADWATGHMHARVLSAHQTTWLTNHSVGYSSRSCSVK